MRMKAHLRREYESNLDYKKFLPNKNYSMRALKRVAAQDVDWACLLVSIENFQNYTETYSELASDKLMQTYAAIIRSALNEDDFLGGLSENEFLIITDGFKAEKLANYLVFAFDSVVEKFYSAQDNKRGFMLMQGDEFAGQRSDFVRTAIGVVTNEFVQYGDPAQLMNALSRTHSLAKKSGVKGAKSAYMIERPSISGAVAENEFNNRVLIIEKDEALSVLLTTILNLQGYEVVLPLPAGAKVNLTGWGEGAAPAVVILDAGDELEGLETLANKDFGSAKIIMTSVVHDKERILSAGADVYLPKPYEPSHLVRWVSNLIN
jgi:PleD family two-component response regulator